MARFFQLLNGVLSKKMDGRSAHRLGQFENTYQFVCNVILDLSTEVEVHSEASNLHGYVDLVVHVHSVPPRVFIFEFKKILETKGKNDFNDHSRTELAKEAVDQIEQKRYESTAFMNYKGVDPEVYKFGVVCSTATNLVVAAADASKTMVDIPKGFARLREPHNL